MKVILLEDINKLGKTGDTVNVKDGYGRNFLIPQKKALDACEGNVRRFTHQKLVLEGRLRKQQSDAQHLVQKVESLRLTITKRAGEEEKLFGSVTNKEIEKALADEGLTIDRKNIQLEEPIKQLGIFSVPVKVYRETTATLKVWVVPATEETEDKQQDG